MPLLQLYGRYSNRNRHMQYAAAWQRCTVGKALLMALPLYSGYGVCHGVILSVVF